MQFGVEDSQVNGLLIWEKLSKNFGWGHNVTLSLKNTGKGDMISGLLSSQLDVMAIRYAVFIAKWSSEQLAIGSNGGLVRHLRTRLRS